MIQVSAAQGAFTFGGLLAVAASVSLAGPPADDVRKGYVPAPPGSETLTAPMDPVSIQMFTDANFLGTQATLSGVDATVPPGALNELPKGLPDKLSSVRWNLPRGVVVVLYENSSARGGQLVVWGIGQAAESR